MPGQEPGSVRGGRQKVEGKREAEKTDRNS